MSSTWLPYLNKDKDRSDTTRSLRHQALDLLARREHATPELAAKLIAKGADSAAVETLLTQLQSEGLLSDARFAAARCHYRRERGFGPLHVSADLLARGVPRQVVTETIDADGDLWLEAARQAKEKRFGPGHPPDRPTAAKWMRFLQLRGFTHQQIHHALNSDEEG